MAWGGGGARVWPSGGGGGGYPHCADLHKISVIKMSMYHFQGCL